MKICFLTRVDAFDKNGGDTYQLQMYKKYFHQYGHDVIINTSLNVPNSFDFYILVNMDRPLELLHYYHILKSRRLLSKTLFLTIHHSYQAVDYFENNIRSGKMKVLTNFTKSFQQREKIKNLIRGIKYRTLFLPAVRQLFTDYKKKTQEIINSVGAGILIAEGEKDIIESDFNCVLKRSILVKNGVDLKNLSIKRASFERDIDILICGRIESRKNSLAVARFLAGTSYKATFVGALNNNDKSYANEFLSIINRSDNLSYLGRVNPDDMPAIYCRSKIHLSASWFEVASLVDLEAYAYGCHVISSVYGHTNSYLKDRAYYLDPKNLSSLNSILEALNTKEADCEEQFSFISNNFTWEKSYTQLFNGLNEINLHQ
ncbi:TPA: glycosyltransferase family 4 protein [Klebsiella pneumoniae]|nr:glycosyltransferase family 4 protein [Klebsiella pneumoniae]HBZ7303476.1 glycosyltransferase family 4 protein [Klebsiella pneumoniae]HBZ7968122.1 glycosyltransferase family 4 protein [Klebsiella pneumoniae]HBZ8109848.1 glycosyltransferase family 4 protein [Klebsiella pneumoniae]